MLLKLQLPNTYSAKCLRNNVMRVVRTVDVSQFNIGSASKVNCTIHLLFTT